MRKIEKQIIETINAKQFVRLSMRDAVRVYHRGDPNECVIVQLHDTDIATIYAESVIVRSGGWRTPTTKSRLNAILWEYCATGISQHRGTWYVQGSPNAPYVGKPTIPFTDGMSFPRKRKHWNGDRWEVSDLD